MGIGKHAISTLVLSLTLDQRSVSSLLTRRSGNSNAEKSSLKLWDSTLESYALRRIKSLQELRLTKPGKSMGGVQK